MSTSITRTRTGCWPCRSRRVKCDEFRPCCSRCIRSGVSCDYGIRLIWHEESLSKGICHGRAGVWSKGGNGRVKRGLSPRSFRSKGAYQRRGRRMSTKFLNTTMRDLDLYFEFERSWVQGRIQPDLDDFDSDVSGKDWQMSLTTVRPSSGPAVFQATDHDPVLLSYYETIICSSSTLLDNVKHNPYRHVILPMTMHSKGLYHATLAVSAQTLRLSDPKYRTAALNHGQKAIQALIQILNQGIDSDIEELLGLALMLCWYEITDRCRPSWVTHLNGIRAISARCRESSTKDSNIRQFFNRYFAFHLVLARTAFRVEGDFPSSTDIISSSPRTHTHLVTKTYEPILSSVSSHQNQSTLDNSSSKLECPEPLTAALPPVLGPTASSEDLDEVDPYMGFSNSLLILINDIADLAWQPTPKYMDYHTPSFKDKAIQLKLSLEALRQKTPKQLEPCLEGRAMRDCTERDYATECMIIAEINRYGALLFLHETCSNRSRIEGSHNQSETFEDDDQATLRLRLPDEDRSNYIHGILDLLERNLSWIIHTAVLPLWPLFLAGCCARTEEDRIRVMDIFDASEELKRFGNIKPAREVVEMVWRQHDLSVQDDRKRRKAAAVYRSPVQDTYSERFVWERATTLMGGWKLSLT